MKDIKFSDYNIIVKSKNNKYNAIQGYTGAFDSFDESIGKLLIERDDKIFNEADEIKEYLYKRGYLCSIEKNEKEQMKRIADIMHRKSTEKYGIAILPTYNCNFRCRYCFEKINKYDKEKVISREMIDNIFKALGSLDRDVNKNICLFGGEPFIRSNHDIVKYIVDIGKTYGFKFFATSNGYDLEYFRDIIDTDKINCIQITLDGLKEYHDNSRYLVGKKPTFDKIVSNIDWCLKKNIKISIRTNISESNISQVENLIKFYKEKKWTRYSNFKFYFSPLDSCGSKDNRNDYNGSRILEKLKELSIDNINPIEIVSVYSSIKKKLEEYIYNNKLVLFQSEACASNRKEVYIDADGLIYSCCNLVGTKYVVGNLDEDRILFNEQFSEWNNRYISNMDKCSSCSYALFCGGGCAAKNVRLNKDINNAVCGEYKNIFNECLSCI